MQLRFSVLATERKFGKAMTRVRPRFDQLLEAFGKTLLLDPIHEAILVGITDDEEPGFFQVVPNSEEFFQVLAGVQWKDSDVELTKDVFAILRRAAATCPFSKPDYATIQKVFDDSMLAVLGA